MTRLWLPPWYRAPLMFAAKPVLGPTGKPLLILNDDEELKPAVAEEDQACVCCPDDIFLECCDGNGPAEVTLTVSGIAQTGGSLCDDYPITNLNTSYSLAYNPDFSDASNCYWTLFGTLDDYPACGAGHGFCNGLGGLVCNCNFGLWRAVVQLTAGSPPTVSAFLEFYFVPSPTVFILSIGGDAPGPCNPRISGDASVGGDITCTGNVTGTPHISVA